jgi:hypothetical protein
VCSRCQKAGAACTFSPPGRAATLTSDLSLGTNQNGNGMAVEDASTLDWPLAYNDIDMNQLLSFPITPQSDDPNPDHRRSHDQRTSNGAPTPLEGHEPVGPPSDSSKNSCTRKLLKLIADADEILQNLPHLSSLHVQRGTCLDANQTLYAIDGFVDTCFNLLQALIDMYPTAIQAALTNESFGVVEDCHIPDCIHETVLPPQISRLSEALSAGSAKRKIDLALANLLSAAHLRVLDIFYRSIACSVACFQLTFSNPDKQEPDFNLPSTRVGSFVPPKASNAIIQVVLFKQLINGLGKSIGSMETAIAEIPDGSGDREIRSMTLQYEFVRERHQIIVEAVGTLLSSLESMG